MDTPETTIPTWGYRADGEARIFDLKPGERLPEGWDSSPTVILDPSRATAEALTDRAAGRPYAELQVSAVAMASATATSNTAMAEIEHLKAIIAAGMKENEELVAEIAKAEDLLTAASAEVATMRTALEKAQADGAEAVTARDEAKAAAERLAAELAEARKDLESATAPKAAVTPAKAK